MTERETKIDKDGQTETEGEGERVRERIRGLFGLRMNAVSIQLLVVCTLDTDN